MTRLVRKPRTSNGYRNNLFPSEFNEVFNDLFENWTEETTSFVPKANIYEEEDQFVIEMAVPGFSKKEIELAVEDKELTISGTREKSEDEKEKNYSRREFAHSDFKRSFTLSDKIDAENINAKYRNGILNVTLPKIPKEKLVKQIKVS